MQEAFRTRRGSLGGSSQLRIFSRGHRLAAAAVLVSGLGAALPASRTSAELIANQVVESAPPRVFDIFLTRLMAAESGGRLKAKNPRSSALGPFQFIKSTFLHMARRHFLAEIAGLTEEEILELRTDPELSRRAAVVFCRRVSNTSRSKGSSRPFRT